MHSRTDRLRETAIRADAAATSNRPGYIASFAIAHASVGAAAYPEFAVAHAANSVDLASDSLSTAAERTNSGIEGYGDYEELFSEFKRDAEACLDCAAVAEIFGSALWRGQSVPTVLSEAQAKFMQILEDDTAIWDFWKRWYTHLRRGDPMPWRLQEAVSLIAEGDWNQGPQRVAERIAEIEARFVLSQTPLAETVLWDTVDGQFLSHSLPTTAPGLLKTVLQLVADSLDDALGGNGLLPGCYEERQLRRMLDRYRGDPQRVEMDCMAVHLRIQGKLGEELPESDEIVGLSDVLLTAALDIRAHHPDVAEARAKRGAQRVRETQPEEIAELREGLEEVRDLLSDDLAEEMGEDIAEVAKALEAGAAPPEDAVIRSANRFARMWLIAKDFGKGVAYGAGGVAAAATGVVALDQAVPILHKMWQFFAPFFGL
ncbi:MAG: hypothetical protein AAFX00_12045 [Pseudomonadota bacterium]